MCSNKSENFCLLCATYLTKIKTRTVSSLIEGLIIKFFEIYPNLSNENIPNKICKDCYTLLTQINQFKFRSLPENYPLLWKENYLCIKVDCYLCSFDKKNLRHLREGILHLKRYSNFIYGRKIKL